MEEEAVLKGVSHVALSVSDLRRSLEFYRDVLKLPMLQPPTRATTFEGEEALLGVGRIGLALKCHDDHQTGAFDHRHTGLDHLAFHVSNRGALEEWQTLLDESSCSHSGIVEVAGFGSMIVFHDPDGVQLELFTTGG